MAILPRASARNVELSLANNLSSPTTSSDWGSNSPTNANMRVIGRWPSTGQSVKPAILGPQK